MCFIIDLFERMKFRVYKIKMEDSDIKRNGLRLSIFWSGESSNVFGLGFC